MTIINETYDVDGYDPGRPNGNVVERVEDNGDGTHTRTVFDEKGNVVDRDTFAVEAAPAAPLTAEEKVAELAALLVEKGVATEAEVVAKLERADAAEVKPR